MEYVIIKDGNLAGSIESPGDPTTMWRKFNALPVYREVVGDYDANNDELTQSSADIQSDKVVFTMTALVGEKEKNRQLAKPIEVKMIENKYLYATKQLLALAGEPEGEYEWKKLEDSEYERIITKAAINDAGMTNILASTIFYCFAQLKWTYNISWDSWSFHTDIL